MTSITLDAGTPRASEARRRLMGVLRLHVGNPRMLWLMPLIFIVGITVVMIGIGAAVGHFGGPDASAEMYDGMRYSGAIFSFIGLLASYGGPAVGTKLPLGMGLGMTRREFFSGTLLFFGAYALALGMFVALARQLEIITHGWFVGVRLYDVIYTGMGSPAWVTVFQVGLPALIILCGIALMATAYARFSQIGILITGIVMAVVVVALAITGVALGAGNAVVAWVIAHVGVSLWIAGAVALMALLTAWYLLNRRYAPR